MELVKCPNCDRPLLSSAETCLKCGRPMNAQAPTPIEQRKGWGLFLLLITKIKALWSANK